MIDAIVTGRLHGKPTQKTAKTGKPFATAKLRVPAGDEALFCNVIAFDPKVCAGLLALEDGDAVALAGALTPKAWLAKDGTPKPAMDVVAHGLLSAYSVTRKRKAQAEAQQPQQARREPPDDWSERDGLGDW